MTTPHFAMIENGRTHEIGLSAAASGESVLRLATKPVLDALGWAQKPEGLCQDDVCIPIAGSPDLITSDGVDLLALGKVLGRPLAIDRDEAVVSFGDEFSAHGRMLAGGVAPDFTLPDLSGKEYSLAGFKGKKVLLIAYASW